MESVHKSRGDMKLQIDEGRTMRVSIKIELLEQLDGLLCVEARYAFITNEAREALIVKPKD